MADPVRVQVLNEVSQLHPSGWRLCFQRCRYVGFDDLKEGYRFIWRRDDEKGSLQAARGQARIPSLREARLLMAKAEEGGWGHYEANGQTALFDTDNTNLAA